VKLQIWDTAGQERFKTITQTYYRGAMGIVLAYAVDDRASFNDIENWVKQIKMHAASDVVKVLVGNKCDSQKREVSHEEGSTLAKQMGVLFFEASAKENVNVTEMFVKVGTDAKRAVNDDKSVAKNS
jgi:small GTP-binding protein